MVTAVFLSVGQCVCAPTKDDKELNSNASCVVWREKDDSTEEEKLQCKHKAAVALNNTKVKCDAQTERKKMKEKEYYSLC